MPFEIIRNDIANMQVDAIVNTANPRPIIGYGVDSTIHQKAGPGLLEARQRIGSIDPGCAAITPAFDLQAKYVIHTVGPIWNGGSCHEEQLLRSCYDNALALALRHGCDSVAFPLISTGTYGFPKDKALQIAISAFSTFLLEQEMQIYLVVFDSHSFKLSEKLFQDVASYIDRQYVEAHRQVFLASEAPRRMQRDMALRSEAMTMPCAEAPRQHAPCNGLDAFLKKKDAGFIETLLALIQKSGLKNSAVYKRANISKQHFSKLINHPDAAVTKPTAVALAMALELDLPQTRDLIGRAGYTLSNSSIFDLIIQYHIENRKYNTVEINIILYEYDQPLLGAQI